MSLLRMARARFQADGFKDEDLAKVDVGFLQVVLNTEEKDFFILWGKFVDKMENEIKPKPVSPPKPVEEKPQINVNITVNQGRRSCTGENKGRPKQKKQTHAQENKQESKIRNRSGSRKRPNKLRRRLNR